MPKLSIVVTIYNKAPYIKRCVNSILNQTYRDFELILVDDGSSDASARICESLLNLDERIRLIRQTHQGVVVSRQTGTNEALGTYIHHVDADDYLEVSMEEALVNAIEENNCDIALTGSYCHRGDNIVESKTGRRDTAVFDRAQIDSDVLPFMIGHDNYNVIGISSSLWSGIYKTELLQPIISSINPQILRGEDALCQFQAIASANRMVIVEGTYYHYCVSPNGITSSPLERHFQSLEKLIEGYLSWQMSNDVRIRRQLPDKFLYHVSRGDSLVLKSGRPQSKAEVEARARVIAAIGRLTLEVE